MNLLTTLLFCNCINKFLLLRLHRYIYIYRDESMRFQYFVSNRSLVILIGCAFASAAAYADATPIGSVSYAPLGGVSVPTLGGWALAALATLLAAAAYRLLRGRVHGRLLSNLLLLGVVAVTGMAGHDLMQQADAEESATSTVNLSNASGGTATVTVPTGATLSTTAVLTNTSGVAQRITALTAVDTATVFPYEGCNVGTVLQPGGSCSVMFQFTPV